MTRGWGVGLLMGLWAFVGSGPAVAQIPFGEQHSEYELSDVLEYLRDHVRERNAVSRFRWRGDVVE